MRGLRAEIDCFKKMFNDFAVRTTNEIDFAKVDKRPIAPGRKHACAAKAAPCQMVVSHYLKIMATMRHYRQAGLDIGESLGHRRYLASGNEFSQNFMNTKI
ncbi:MAG: hypothetical protein A4E49_01185 [Methanosaeta sp. PtaU1.Bin112]|nr:MAG: hypothetical protein A4E49_01185 [Methanosaeta sp. PtaU1.Bin112]